MPQQSSPKLPTGPIPSHIKTYVDPTAIKASESDASEFAIDTKGTPWLAIIFCSAVIVVIAFVMVSRAGAVFVSLRELSIYLAWAYLSAVSCCVVVLGIYINRVMARLRRIRNISSLQEMSSQLNQIDDEELRSKIEGYLGQLANESPAETNQAIERIYERFSQYSGDAKEDIETLNEYLLDELDCQAKRIVDRHAVQITIATALASHPFDSLIIIWHSFSTVSEVSQLYFGRPGLFGAIQILRRALSAIVFAEIAELAAKAAAEFFSNNPMIALGGRTVEGLANGVMMIRLGEAIRRQCRPIKDVSKAENSIVRLSQALIQGGWLAKGDSPVGN